MSSIEAYHQQLCDSNISWFKRYEQELEERGTVSLKLVEPYIEFKLVNDFAFTTGNSIDIHDPLAINYFMGNFCYDQVVKDFKRSAIVMQTEKERMYFGSPSIARRRMRSLSLRIKKSVDDFDNFIESLEENLFLCRLSDFDARQRDTLGMILRIINQGVGAVAINMLNRYLQVRSGDSKMDSLEEGNDVTYLMRPDKSDEKGSTQIDIICGADGKIQLSRREYLKVQKLDLESLIEPKENKAERWCILMLLSRDSADESSDWRLHYSVSNIARSCERMDNCGASGSKSKSRLSTPVAKDRRVCSSDPSFHNSSNGSETAFSIRNIVKLPAKPDSKKSSEEQTKKRRRRPIRDFLLNYKVKKQATPNYSTVECLQQYEDYSKINNTILFQEVQPYIDFKLAHDLSLAHDNVVEIEDWTAINYFLGDFCSSRVRQGFLKNAIVITTETEKRYSSTSVSTKTHISGSETENRCNNFEAFINLLERKVFKGSLWSRNDHEKQTLCVILRFISQNGSAVALKVIEQLLESRSANSETDEWKLHWEGSAIISIEFKDKNIYLTKEEILTLHTSENDSNLRLPVDTKEIWKIMTKIRLNSFNSCLHFSAVPQSRQDRLTPTYSSRQSFSSGYPQSTSPLSTTSCSSLKTEIYDNSPRRSVPDSSLTDSEEVKDIELGIFPGRKCGMLSDDLSEFINKKTMTAMNSVVDKFDNITRCRWLELEKDKYQGMIGEWITKDEIGI